MLPVCSWTLKFMAKQIILCSFAEQSSWNLFAKFIFTNWEINQYANLLNKDNKTLRILHYNKSANNIVVNANCQFKDCLRVVIAPENLKCPEIVQLTQERNFDRYFHNFDNYTKYPHDISSIILGIWSILNIINTKIQILLNHAEGNNEFSFFLFKTGYMTAVIWEGNQRVQQKKKKVL